MQASLSLILQFTSCEVFQREKSFLIMQFDVVLDFCSKSHDDRVLFEPTSAIWAHIA